MTTRCTDVRDEDLVELVELVDTVPRADPNADPIAVHVRACADCQARLAGYQRLVAALPAVGATYRPAPDALARAQAAIRREQRRHQHRRRLLMAAPAVAAAALLLLLVWPRPAPPPPAPGLTVEVTADPRAPLRSASYGVGDRLRVDARGEAHRHAALWIYRNDRELQLSCPPTCAGSSEAGSLAAELVFDGIGRYQIIWVRSAEPLGPPPSSLAAAVSAAGRDGTIYELHELDVR